MHPHDAEAKPSVITHVVKLGFVQDAILSGQAGRNRAYTLELNLSQQAFAEDAVFWPSMNISISGRDAITKLRDSITTFLAAVDAAGGDQQP